MTTAKSLKSNYLKDFFISVWIIVVSVPVTVLFPFLVVFVVTPIKAYSRFIAYLSYLSDPYKGRIITGLGAGQIRDINEIYTKPRSAEVVCLRMKGPLDYDEILDALHKRVLMKLDNAKTYPALHYPELQQYFTTFMGYVFLKTDHSYDVKNHFTVYNKNSRSTPITRNELMRIWEELMIKPFAKDKSAWEIVIIDNYIPDKDELESWNNTKDVNITSSEEKYWVAFIKVHHGMADGFSVQKMLSYLIDEVFLPKFTTAKITPFQNFLMSLRTLTLGPYDVIWRWYRGRESYHSLHLPPAKQSGEYFVIESKLISTNRVKEIRNKFGVPFTAVLVTAISGGMRKYFQKYDIAIPAYLSTGIPLATSEHSDKLTNEFLLATVEYAVNLDDPKARLDYVLEKMKLLETTSWIYGLNFIVDLLGNLPQPIFKRLTQRQIFSSTYSTQPGPPRCVTCFGSTLLEVNYSYGCGIDSSTFGISTITYNGNFRIVLFIDKNAVQSRIAAENMIEFISEEFDVLDQYPYNANANVVNQDKRETDWAKSIKYD